MRHVIGIDIGGTKCAVIYGIADQDQMTFVERHEIATKGSWEAMLKQLVVLAKQLIEAYPALKTGSIGVSCGGPLNTRQGLILSPPNLPGWDEVPVTAYLEKELSLPAALRNDADACALAEWRYGAGRGCQHMIFLTFGTGLGAGLILNGRLYEGACGMAGEAGHLRLAPDGPIGHGKAGSFEGFCSGGGISQIAKQQAMLYDKEGKKVSYLKTTIEHITTKDVAEMAADGQTDALEVFRLSGDYLGKGLAILIDLLNPEKIVIGSVFARSGQFMTKMMTQSLIQEALPESRKCCDIVPALLGERIGDYAAVMVALEIEERK